MDPYQLIADIYEAEFGALETDVAYFSRTGGPGAVLVLGCGTGRICRGLEALRPVVGVDRSAPMIELARSLSPKTRYVVADMRHFDRVPEIGRFDEILIPNASFNFLPTRADQAECLGACARSLRPGGTLVLDLPMPDPTWLHLQHSPEKPAWEGHVGGRLARRTREVFRFPVAQRLELVDRYYVDDALVATSPLHLRSIYPAEVEWMLENAGFYVDSLHGDHAGNPLREGCPRLIVRAVL